INFQAWNLDRRSEVASEYYKIEGYMRADLWGEPTRFALIETGGMERRFCHVQVTTRPGPIFAICSRDEFNGVIYGDCENDLAFTVPWYYSLPPQTPLIRLR